MVPNAYAIFLQAESFRATADLLYEQIQNLRPEFATPIFVNTAFAAEVYLKCLHAIESQHVPRGHRLDELFNSLGKEIQQHAEELWQKRLTEMEETISKIEEMTGTNMRISLRDALFLGARSFETFRYIYEGPPGHEAQIQDFPYIFSQVVLRLRPEWGLKPFPGFKKWEDFIADED